jgi:hypothetical protein
MALKASARKNPKTRTVYVRHPDLWERAEAKAELLNMSLSAYIELGLELLDDDSKKEVYLIRVK